MQILFSPDCEQPLRDNDGPDRHHWTGQGKILETPIYLTRDNIMLSRVLGMNIKNVHLYIEVTL